ncbi:MAG: hypothetical protein NC120_12385 [Ruminococcus sp.]|nr:hypothetical protein [Ruminococcus sp.]
MYIEKSEFEYGELYMTRGIDERMHEGDLFKSFVAESVNRYLRRDWGDTCEEDADLNDEALKSGDRLLAVYIFPKTGETIWIITEADRSVTTVLLPEEY